MLKYISLRLVSVALLTVISVIGAAAQAHFHVTICHRTGSRTNPYIQISPDVEGVVNGHMDHEQTGNGLGGDIIPLFEFMGQTYSKNLDTDFGGGLLGRDILANGCRVDHNTPTPGIETLPDGLSVRIVGPDDPALPSALAVASGRARAGRR